MMVRRTGARFLGDPWSAMVRLQYGQSWDSNVFLQDETDLGERSSWLVKAGVMAELGYRPSARFEAKLEYEGIASFYFSEPSEDNWSHRIGASASGILGDDTKWSIRTDVTLIDGDGETPIYTGPGGAPCFGGIEVMARRDAIHWTGSAQIRQPTPVGFVRQVVNWKWNNYRTRQMATPGYLNYTDRLDVGGGIDLGWRVLDGVHLITGYRVGYQWEDAILEDPTEYSNLYQRALFGIEGKPAPWLDLSIVAGPDFRDFESNVAPGFDGNEILLYADASAEISMTRNDAVALKVGRFEQPGFCGRSAYEDISYGTTWKHRFGPSVRSELGVLLHGADFQGPTDREDWILTATAMVEWKPTGWSAIRAGYQFDNGGSAVPGTEGREYRRHFAGVECSFTFDSR
jgi:hypothetical protein